MQLETGRLGLELNVGGKHITAITKAEALFSANRLTDRVSKIICGRYNRTSICHNMRINFRFGPADAVTATELAQMCSPDINDPRYLWLYQLRSVINFTLMAGSKLHHRILMFRTQLQQHQIGRASCR